MKKFLLFMLLALGFEISAQSSFQVYLDTNQIKIGEPIQLLLEAKIPEGASYIWPVLEDSLKVLEVIERGSLDSLIEGNGILTLRQNYRITSFDSGDVYVPSLVLQAGNKTLSSDSSLIRVFFPEIKQDQDYYDIKDPKEIPYNYWLILWYALAGLALLIGIYFLIKKWPKKTPEQRPTEILDSRSPEEWALDALRELESKGLWQKGEEKTYYSELVDILRHFLERKYGMKAMESTAEELISKLSSKVNDSELRKSLNQSLRLSALVKYARQKGLPHENEQALEAIRKFVDQHQKEESNDV